MDRVFASYFQVLLRHKVSQKLLKKTSVGRFFEIFYLILQPVWLRRNLLFVVEEEIEFRLYEKKDSVQSRLSGHVAKFRKIPTA
ncbi:MAG: hypothetical protein KH188_09325 [Prevotella sp.]|nr:hypothetical protein [Prevotella sp.]